MNMKFKIESPEHSKRIQEELFKLGGVWCHDGNHVKYTNEPYLYIINEKISYGSSEWIFIDDKSQEKTLADLIEMNKKDEGLIGGDEAKKAWANGKVVEFRNKSNRWYFDWSNILDAKNGFSIQEFDQDGNEFRLKPQTVTINGVEYNKVKKTVTNYSEYTIEIQLSSRDDTEKLREYIEETFM